MAEARLSILAGVNGAGKSSIAGAMIRDAGGEYFNPDEVARKIRTANPSLSREEANGLAWQEGVRLLRRAVAESLVFTLETTLGGDTITDLLAEAALDGAQIRVWYAGLSSVELHVARVLGRVRAGGHDIPEADIRRRYRSSRLNLIRLIPHLAELRVFDNSHEADPKRNLAPAPVLLLHMKHGKVVGPRDLRATPEWAKPIVAAVLKRPRGPKSR